MKQLAKYILILVPTLVLAGCAHKTASSASADSGLREFPLPQAPEMYSDDQKRDYVIDHFWDGFFAGDGKCDTTAVLGVDKHGVETNLALFINLMDKVPMDKAQSGFRKLFEKMEAKQAADTSSHVYLLMRDMVSKYLYDPNSPYRNEDYYLPFVEGLANSPLTPEDVRPGYVFEAKMCSMNQYGTPVPDFSFKDSKGTVHHLYGVKADYTVLFFSNPGCNACKEIIDALTSRPYMEPMVKDGRLAIVNIYIDEEIDKWRAYLPNYPAYWVSGYDYRTIIRNDELYNVRAIPSLYVLDAEKKVIFKDVPTEKALSFLDRALAD